MGEENNAVKNGGAANAAQADEGDHIAPFVQLRGWLDTAAHRIEALGQDPLTSKLVLKYSVLSHEMETVSFNVAMKVAYVVVYDLIFEILPN